ncbi:unnamed protein product, partial [Larinioides sclopetarius]
MHVGQETGFIIKWIAEIFVTYGKIICFICHFIVLSVIPFKLVNFINETKLFV